MQSSAEGLPSRRSLTNFPLPALSRRTVRSGQLSILVQPPSRFASVMLTWALKKLLGTSHEREIKQLRPLVEAINKLEADDGEADRRRAQGEDRRVQARSSTTAPRSTTSSSRRSPSAARPASASLRMRHYDVQLIGGMVLHNGMIAEMRTGEGKTLVATLPCYLNALEGKGVHVVTVNDYLARRDAEWMGKLYGFLGLTHRRRRQLSRATREDATRTAADITYGQNNEFGFDYLRDNMKFSALDYAQRELNYAIVDEVDSILIDEARTPLIISGQAEALEREVQARSTRSSRASARTSTTSSTRRGTRCRSPTKASRRAQKLLGDRRTSTTRSTSSRCTS